MGSQTVPFPSPGSRTAYSTTLVLPGRVQTLAAYCSGERICSRIAPSWISPRMPRVLTFGKHLLDIADPRSEGLHFAEALVDLLQPLGNLGKGLLQPRVEGFLELFIHSAAHFLKPAGIILPHPLKLLGGLSGEQLKPALHPGKLDADRLLQRIAAQRKLLVQVGNRFALHLGGMPLGFHQGLSECGNRSLGGTGGFPAVFTQLVGQFVPQRIELFPLTAGECAEAEQGEEPKAGQPAPAKRRANSRKSSIWVMISPLRLILAAIRSDASGSILPPQTAPYAENFRLLRILKGFRTARRRTAYTVNDLAVKSIRRSGRVRLGGAPIIIAQKGKECIRSMGGKRMAFSLALSGGGCRGAAHIGVLMALEEAGLRPAALSGASAGRSLRASLLMDTRQRI